MMGYYRPFTRKIKRGQRFGANPGLGPNPRGGHNGDDHLTPVGTPVHAAGDGVVVFAGEFDSTYEDNFGWNLHYGGKMVVLNLDGAEGPYVEYGHLLEYHVKAGDRVTGAQVIALSGNTDGNTGVSTGPHCHVGVLPPNFNLNTDTYGRVDPDLYLTEWPEDRPAGSLSYASESITPITRPSGEDDFLMALSQETQAGMAHNSYLNLDSNARIEAQNRAILETLSLILPAVARIDTRVAENVDVQGRIEKNQALALESQAAVEKLAAAAAAKAAE